MYDLAIGIVGSGDTTYNNAADLLWDWLPDNYVIYIPSYINSEGMKTVWKFLQDEGINYERVKKSTLIETLADSETKSRQLVILNPSGIENEISRCFDMKIPVYDLTRGLYQLTEVPVNDAESNAVEISPGAFMTVTPSNDLGLESLLARLDKMEQTTGEIMKGIQDMRAQIATGETGWEPAQNIIPPEEDVLGAGETGFRTGVYDPDAGKVAYWKSKRGKLRKAGKSKARPGETLVHLTPEEVSKLD